METVEFANASGVYFIYYRICITQEAKKSRISADDAFLVNGVLILLLGCYWLNQAWFWVVFSVE
jgi:hypothetical protein